MLLSVVAIADCADDPSADALARAQALEEAYLHLKEELFDSEHAALIRAIGCLDQPLTLEQVVALHEAKALASFVDGELAASRKSWAAVQQLVPGFEPDTSLMPVGHPMRGQFDDAPTDTERVPLERSPEGGWRVDGAETTEVPKNRAFLLQGFDLSGSVVHSAYHYSVAEVPQVDFAQLDETARERRRKRMHWIGSIAAGALTVGSGTTAVLAASAESMVKNDQTRLGELDDKALTANNMSYASLGMIGGAAAIGSLTWVVRW